MFIVALNGSPKSDGNTAFLLQKILDEVGSEGAETRHIHVHKIMEEQKHPYCNACSSPCRGTCFSDTTLSDTYDLLKKADAIILGSPVYFGTVSAQLKGFWDKTRKLRGEKGLMNAVGGAVSPGGARFGGQETTLRALHDMMLVQGMIVVGDGYVADDCGHHGVCSQQPSEEDSFALKRASILSRRITEVARATANLRIRE